MTPQDLREEAFLLLGRVVTRSDPGRLEAWAGLGLTMTQLRVLFMLRDGDGVPAGALAESLGVTPSTLTRIMDRLVQNRLVRREPDEEDRRLVRHRLTNRGRSTVQELERSGRARMDAILDHMSVEQLERLVAALRDFTDAVEKADLAAEARVEA